MISSVRLARAVSSSSSLTRALVVVQPACRPSIRPHPPRPASFPFASCPRCSSSASSSTPADPGLRTSSSSSPPDLPESQVGQPSSTFLKTRLTTALAADQASSTYGPDLISSILPLLSQSKLHLLLPFTQTIASALSTHFRLHPPSLDLVTAATQVFTFCSFPPSSGRSRVQVNRSRNSKHGNFTARESVQPYVEWLLSEASSERERVDAVLIALEGELEQYASDQGRGERGIRVPVPLAAAWGVLRARVGRVSPPTFEVALPHPSTVVAYLKDLSREFSSKETGAIEALCVSQPIVALPKTVDALQRRLLSLMSRGQTETIAELWTLLLAQLRPEAGDSGASTLATLSPGTTSSQYVGSELVKSMNRYHTLSAFLLTFRTLALKPVPTVSGRPIASIERRRMRQLATDLLALVPSPTPMPILHTLLSTVVPPKDEIPGLDSGDGPNEGEGTPMTPRQQALKVAEEVWTAPGTVQAVKDVKAYMLCIALMGTLKHLEGVVRVWDQMADDSESRQAKAKEAGKEASGIAWPPTEVLNHTLDQLFSMGGAHPEHAALELFRRAVDSAQSRSQPGSSSSSSLAPNIITINTVLRHSALSGDMPGMTSVLSTAQTLSLVPDIVTYTTLVQGMLRAGEDEAARRTLSVMRDRGIEPNEYMSALLVSDLARDGDAAGLARAETMVVEMKKRGVKLSTQMWTSLVAGYFRGGWEGDGWDAVRRMQSAGGRLNTVTYNVLIRQSGGKGRSRRADRADRGGDRRRGAGGSWGAGAVPTPTSTAPSLPMQLFDHMVQNNVAPDKDTYWLMLDNTVSTGRVDEAGKVLEVMERVGFEVTTPSLKAAVVRARKAGAGAGAGTGGGGVGGRGRGR